MYLCWITEALIQLARQDSFSRQSEWSRQFLVVLIISYMWRMDRLSSWL